jgi:hypothetical protein
MIGLSRSEVKSTFLMNTIGKNYRAEDEKPASVRKPRDAGCC